GRCERAVPADPERLAAPARGAFRRGVTCGSSRRRGVCECACSPGRIRMLVERLAGLCGLVGALVGCGGGGDTSTSAESNLSDTHVDADHCELFVDKAIP